MSDEHLLGGASSAPEGPFNVLCVDGPLEGKRYVFTKRSRQGVIIWLGPKNGYPYRAVQDDDGTWYYVYADSIDDDFPLP